MGRKTKPIEPIKGLSFPQMVKAVATYTPPDSIVNKPKPKKKTP